MTISIWRYSHLALAVSSFLFIALAAVTGLILAIEPINQLQSSYRTQNLEQVSIAQAVTTLKSKYPGITDVDVSINGLVTMKGTDAAGKKLWSCVNVRTGQALGTPPKQNEFFQWVTGLHRSLFMHEVGRAFVGLAAFLLLLIALSGTVLVIRRQRGVKHFFDRIVKENLAQYGHVVLGRLSLIPILIIALSGTYLSLFRFQFFPVQKIQHQVDIDHMKTDPQRKVADFPIFIHTSLADVRSIQFPFSEFPEDYYTLKLKDRELVVNQFTGDILSEIKYRQANIWADLSLTLHTGRASIIWALVLAVAAVNILFFIWSGFVITLRRKSGKIRNKFKATDSEIIILVGSENGSTFRFAAAVYQQLLQQEHKAYVTELNHYANFPQARHLIIMAASYGQGEAPSNASGFTKLLANTPPNTLPLHYSVVGFGSRAYPDFCKFAFEISQLLQQTTWATPLVDIHTVNDKSPADLALWAEAWSQQSGIPLTLPADLSMAPTNLKEFEVTSNTTIQEPGHTFLLRLAVPRRQRPVSGDLLAVYPASDYRERLYSIGMIDNEIQLSVRLHPNGLGSSFLQALKPNDLLQARIVNNPHFHFPRKAQTVIMVANGTGIAPFLGMISQNSGMAAIHLYCGFRERLSFEPYEGFLKNQTAEGKLTQTNLALSREGDKQYVSDLLAADGSLVAETLTQGGYLMLCGSLAMQKDVLGLLEFICDAHTPHQLSWYQSRGQLLMDCY
ncbi:PepSY domain-containing protein [Mucilaginibacter sp. CSA2-8R]|uniref:PepSY domain-containing protein n=1 Tax=Mucilaginibacter sp. CSA2-8R TaxID=3141542 RepID=UPI00315CECFA